MKSGILIVSLVLVVGALGVSSSAFAAPSVLDDKSSSASDMDAKKAKAKECSDKADAKGLHGEARKKFRSECKKAK